MTAKNRADLTTDINNNVEDNTANAISAADVRQRLLDIVDSTFNTTNDTDLTALIAAFIPASASGPASFDFAEDTDNGTNRVRVAAPSSLSADADVTLPGATGTILSTGESKTLSKGFDIADYNAGTFTSGTFTPDPVNGQIQRAVNNGAHTLAAPSKICQMVIYLYNDTSAGAVTLSGWTIITGDAIAATAGNDALLYITVAYSGSVYKSHLHVERLS